MSDYNLYSIYLLQTFFTIIIIYLIFLFNNKVKVLKKVYTAFNFTLVRAEITSLELKVLLALVTIFNLLLIYILNNQN